MPAVVSIPAKIGAGRANNTKSIRSAARNAIGNASMEENSSTISAASAINNHCEAGCETATSAIIGINRRAPTRRRVVPDMLALSTKRSG